MIKEISSNQSCGKDRECKMVRFKVPKYTYSHSFRTPSLLSACTRDPRTSLMTEKVPT